jgi:uncharacterized membrane protein YphA (DoxX/SURF4 family)
MFKQYQLRDIAPTILRIGLSMVFLWFGTQQLHNPSAWVSLIPSWVTGLSGLKADIIVMSNGSFEVVFGIALIIGLYTRVTSFLLAFHMLSIVWAVGYSATGVRDFGLFMGIVTVFLYGADELTLDNVYKHKLHNNPPQQNAAE